MTIGLFVFFIGQFLPTTNYPLLTSNIVFAQTNPANDPSVVSPDKTIIEVLSNPIKPNTTDFPGFIGDLYKFAYGISGIVAVGMIVAGAIYYTISGDSPQKAQEGKDMIWNALWGIGLLAGSYVILRTINPELVSLNIGNIENFEAQCEAGKVWDTSTRKCVPQPPNIVSCNKDLLSNTAAHCKNKLYINPNATISGSGAGSPIYIGGVPDCDDCDNNWDDWEDVSFPLGGEVWQYPYYPKNPKDPTKAKCIIYAYKKNPPGRYYCAKEQVYAVYLENENKYFCDGGGNYTPDQVDDKGNKYLKFISDGEQPKTEESDLDGLRKC